MLPDELPSQPEIKNILTSYVHEISSSGESSDENIDIHDEESVIYQGYEALPSGPTENNENCHDSFEESETEENINNLDQCILRTLDSNELNGFGNQIDFSTPLLDTMQSEIWNQPNQNDIELTDEKLQTIEKCMANIKLDFIKAPEWAKSIPENEWKENLLKQIIMKQ